MEKRSALKLRQGDVVHYGNCRRTCDHRWRRTGVVDWVTPNGCVIVEIVPPGETPRPWWLRGWNSLWETEGVPYDHVFLASPWTGVRLSAANA